MATLRSEVGLHELGNGLSGSIDEDGSEPAVTIWRSADELVAFAARLAELERLRGDDAVHLAAALTVEATVFSSADTALCSAAARRGVHVANPLEP